MFCRMSPRGAVLAPAKRGERSGRSCVRLRGDSTAWMDDFLGITKSESRVR
jgi:hypothetical protein